MTSCGGFITFCNILGGSFELKLLVDLPWYLIETTVFKYCNQKRGVLCNKLKCTQSFRLGAGAGININKFPTMSYKIVLEKVMIGFPTLVSVDC